MISMYTEVWQRMGVLQLKYLQGPVRNWNPVFLFFFPFIFISWRLITLQYCSGNPVFQWIQDLSITEIPLFHVFVNKKNHYKLKMTQCFLPENASGILFIFDILFIALQETVNQDHYSNNKYLLYNIKFIPSPFTQFICLSMSNHSEFSNSKWLYIYICMYACMYIYIYINWSENNQNYNQVGMCTDNDMRAASWPMTNLSSHQF